MKDVRNFLAKTSEIAGAAAEALEKGENLYRKFHGGHNGWNREPLIVEVPDLAGAQLIQLGALAGLSYVTAKEAGRHRPDIFDHKFGLPRPSLAFNPETGDLVIVRGMSRYSVNGEGWIVG